MSHIHAHRPYGGLVAQAHAGGVGEIGKQIIEIHGPVNVAAIVKRGRSQWTADEWHGNSQRKAQLSVGNHQHLAAHRYADVLIAPWIVRWADQHRALRTCAIQAEATQRAPAPGKETLADGNMAAAKRPFHTQTNTVGPHQ